MNVKRDTDRERSPYFYIIGPEKKLLGFFKLHDLLNVPPNTPATQIIMGSKYVTPSLAVKLAQDIDIGNETPIHAKLSNREYEVMCMISSGKKNKEIAEEILVSPKTVSSYKKRILDKMGMKTNAQLTEYAIRNGLIN